MSKMLRFRRFIAVAAVLGALVVEPALAELKPGATAPPFHTAASLGGNVFGFDMAEALKRGPVVLYFYPAAFTTGCTLEAHDFAEHAAQYKALGATLIGVSGDDIATLKRFSVSECRSKFPVASDATHAISKAYDAVLGAGDSAYSDRTSYVIARDGKIVYAYRALDPSRHVANTLAALEKLRRE